MVHPSQDLRQIKFLGFVSDAESLAVLQRLALIQGWDTSCAHQGTPEDAVKYLANHPSPDFLLVDLPSAQEAPAALDKLADVCDPGVKVIVTSALDEYSFYRWLTDIGVHHYLLKPLIEQNIALALQSQADKAPDSQQNDEAEKRLIAVIGTRGGIGATTVSLNIAAAYAKIHHIKTLLLDLAPQWGTVSLMLDLEPGRGLREALDKPDRIDALFMERVLLKYSEHLHVLSSEEPFDETITYRAEAATTLLTESFKKADIVVADVPRETNPFTISFLKAATDVILVTEPSLIGLRDTMRLADYLKDTLKVKHVMLVSNRHGLFGKYEMPKADFEKSVGIKFEADIPFDMDAFGKMAAGELLMDIKSHSPMVKTILTLVSHLMLKQDQKTSQKPKQLGWLKGKK